jgi:hypothetical protein
MQKTFLTATKNVEKIGSLFLYALNRMRGKLCMRSAPQGEASKIHRAPPPGTTYGPKRTADTAQDGAGIADFIATDLMDLAAQLGL